MPNLRYRSFIVFQTGKHTLRKRVRRLFEQPCAGNRGIEYEQCSHPMAKMPRFENVVYRHPCGQPFATPAPKIGDRLFTACPINLRGRNHMRDRLAVARNRNGFPALDCPKQLSQTRFRLRSRYRSHARILQPVIITIQ